MATSHEYLQSIIALTAVIQDAIQDGDLEHFVKELQEVDNILDDIIDTYADQKDITRQALRRGIDAQ